MSDKPTRVKRLIENEDLQQAFRDVRNAIHQQFERASVTDVEILVGLKHKLNLLDSVWANLEAAVEDGELRVWREKQAKTSFLGDLNGTEH